jgi:hypothetical protein
MPFIQPYLLAGLVLAGLPVLLHLMLRQKPRVLSFPAFRFLKQRHVSNTRRLRLQHLLLLLLRIALIALLCLALARPLVNLSGLGLHADQATLAVFVVDTSPSMGYTVGKQTRLDEARRKARELLAEMAEGSRVAVLDAGDDEGRDAEPLPLSAALARLDGLRLRPAAGPLQPVLDRAFRLLQKAGEAADAPPRFLYVFSDRTRACWEPARAGAAKRPDGAPCVFVDVGVDDARDLAIDRVEVEPAVAAPGGRVLVRVAVRAVGGDYENELSCQIDNDPEPGASGERQKTVKVAKGETQTVTFVRQAPRKVGDGDFPCQVTVRLATSDALPFNNVRHATFLVRKPRFALAIADDPRAAGDWRAALEAVGVERPADAFQCKIQRPADAEKLSDEQLRTYKVVCLFQTIQPAEKLWAQLADFVGKGGGLVIVPAGEELQGDKVKGFNEAGAKAGLLPAALQRIVTVGKGKPGVPWAGFDARHALTAPFRRWSDSDTPDLERPDVRPIVNAYWEVEPVENALAVARYADDERRPSLVERAVGRGRVLQFTTVLDGRMVERNRPWNNYFSETWFGLVLVNETCRYLAGDATKPAVNFTCGQPVVVELPRPTPHADYPYRLLGPELSESESLATGARDQQMLELKQAAAPGNYTVYDEQNTLLAGCSLNIRTEESDLERVPPEEIEKVLGENSLLPAGQAASMRDALRGRWSPPVELLPWLMLLVLLALTVESILANKVFHRPPAELPETAP